MFALRHISVIVLLWLVASNQAFAYQYAGYAPYGYVQPPRAYNPYAPHARPAPYPPAYQYPASYRYPQQHRPVFRSPRPEKEHVTRPSTSTGSPAAETRTQTASVKSSAVARQPGKYESSTNNGNITAATNKKDFIEALLPHIEKENQRLLSLRYQVADLFEQVDNDENGASRQLQRLAKQYRVKGNVLTSTSAREELLSKIDIIPSSLALAQAASESAWGKSRFATEANNLFGIWTYDEAKGIKPKHREQGKKHLVRIFDDIGESVRYYMHTLNSHPAYAELRAIRLELRESGREISGLELAAGLEKYSAKGQEYIDLIRNLIRQNRWAQLDTGNRPA